MSLSDLRNLPEAIKELARYAVVESEPFDLIAPKGISQEHLNELYRNVNSAVEGDHAFTAFCGIRDAYNYAHRRSLPFESTSTKESVLKLKSSIPKRTAKYLGYSQKDDSLQEFYQEILSAEETACSLALGEKYQEAVDVYRGVVSLRIDLSNKSNSMNRVS
jgi:hypothetical protein